MGQTTLSITGKVQKNAGAFSKRISDFTQTFVHATGIPNLHAGTLNVWSDEYVAIWPDFMIKGEDLDNPDQDCLFEGCKIIVDGKEYSGFRVRPFHRPTGGGGNGDKCLEIIAETIPGVVADKMVTLEFTRNLKP